MIVGDGWVLGEVVHVVQKLVAERTGFDAHPTLLDGVDEVGVLHNQLRT